MNGTTFKQSQNSQFSQAGPVPHRKTNTMKIKSFLIALLALFIFTQTPDARANSPYQQGEVTADVFDSPQSLVIEQGHHRLTSARGAIAWVIGG